jgi:rsbT co-antagonist protein RsbR
VATIVIIIAIWFSSRLVRPINRLAESASAIAAGDLDTDVDTGGSDEIGDLARSFAEMQHSVRDLVTGQERQIEALTTPLIPLRDDVVVLPIVGELDSRRIEKLGDGLVAGVYERGARAAIIDLTGSRTTHDPAADEEALAVLLRAMQSVRLLGVDVVITGMQAEVATRFTASDLDLSGILTEPTLQMGIDRAARVRRGMD